MKKCIRMLLISLVLLQGTFASVSAYDFKIHSQNFLHLGWGTTTANKCTALQGILANVDVVVIQELMVNNIPCNSTVIAGFTPIVEGPFGNGYKEYYGFLIRNTPSTGKPTITYTGINWVAAGNYIRTPVALLLNVTPSGSTTPYKIWVGSMHSIFGKKVSQRQAEAILFGGFFAQLRTADLTAKPLPTPLNGWPVLFGGDWNIPVTNKAGTKYNAGFTWLTAQNASGDPQYTPTSLSNTGAPASPYDHFIFSSIGSGAGAGGVR